MNPEAHSNPPAPTANETPTNGESVNIRKLQRLAKDPSARPESYQASEVETTIIEQIAERRKELENTAFEQDIKLKKSTLERLFIFLGSETIVIFLFALMQGLKLGGFKLEEWSFKLLVAATITQITTMLLVAVKHLFPQKK
ncbi:MAG TPA: hypothetical protein VJA27_02500 [Patescibacteria group bacterium]|nr:hypothetical protein [Patescibacteria group bacterium]